MEERLRIHEVVNDKLSKQLNSLVMDMETLQASVKDQQAFPSLPGPGYLQHGRDMRVGKICGSRAGVVDGEHGRAEGSSEDFIRKTEEMCAAGRRVVGFTQIETRMLELQIQSCGAKNMEEAMMMDVKVT